MSDQDESKSFKEKENIFKAIRIQNAYFATLLQNSKYLIETGGIRGRS
jgi:hypothetical protein